MVAPTLAVSVHVYATSIGLENRAGEIILLHAVLFGSLVALLSLRDADANRLGCGLLSARGRIDRLQYLGFQLASGAAQLCCGVTAYAIARATAGPVAPLLVLPVAASVFLGICQAIRRLHDLGRPGTDVWLGLVPVYNVYLALILLIRRGDDGPNAYGPEPAAVPGDTPDATRSR